MWLSTPLGFPPLKNLETKVPSFIDQDPFSTSSMATKFTTTVIQLKPLAPPKHTAPSQLLKVSAQRSDGVADSQETSSSPTIGPPPSARAQLDLLDQLTSTRSADYQSDSGELFGGRTIRDQLEQLGAGLDGEFSVPLGKNLKKFSAKYLTTSQKRNIKRQTYLKEVSRRNDSVFFATVGAFVLLPPLVILAIAVLTGYVQLFP